MKNHMPAIPGQAHLNMQGLVEVTMVQAWTRFRPDLRNHLVG